MILFIAIIIFLLITSIIHCAATCKTKEDQDIFDKGQLEFIRRHNKKHI